MFVYAFAVMVLGALLSSSFYITMRVRLIRMDTARDRIAWLNRSSDEVLHTYEALFPRSFLPRFCRFSFWAFLVFAAVMLCFVLLSSR